MENEQRSKLTNELLATYIGGQLEIQNEGERYIFRGEIKAAVVEPPDGPDAKLKVEFAWCAKGDSFPPIRWVNETNLQYAISLDICSLPLNIGPSGGDIGGSDRLILSSYIICETLAFYPPDGSRLDPARVEGLVLAR